MLSSSFNSGGAVAVRADAWTGYGSRAVGDSPAVPARVSGDHSGVGGGAVIGRAVGALTCQALRGPDEGWLTRLLSLEPGPVAARLRRGISASAGGPMGVCVHGVSASATSLGVW